VLQPPGNLRRERILTGLKAERVDIIEVLALDSTLATLEFVEHSDYVTILPAMAMLPEIERRTLCVRPLQSRFLHLDLVAIEPSRRAATPIADLLVAAFTQSIAAVERRVVTGSTRASVGQ